MSRSRTSVRHKLPVETLEPRILLAKQVIWIEGESATGPQTNFVDYWLRATADPAKLSGGNWLVHSNGGAAFAQYGFNVPETGTYQLWLRLQTVQAPESNRASYTYRIDTGATTPLDLIDNGSMSPIDRNYNGTGWANTQVGWIYGGSVELSAGSHQIRVNSTGGQGGIDAIGMANYTWVPSLSQPNPDATPAATDWFPFTARPDDFSSSSAIDLSYLNEDNAGDHGNVVRVGDHYEFSGQPGVPVKFWGIDASPVSDPAHIDAQARWYAKHGINIVRLAHLDDYFSPGRDAAGNPTISAAKWDQFDRFFKALKDNGIYMDWSMVWKYPINALDGYPDALRQELVNGNGSETYGHVNYMQQLQDIRWKFVSMILNHQNPYTGMKYADDPALAVVEIQNEDDIFFWNPLSQAAGDTTSMPLHRAELQKLWQQWVKTKYGNDTALRAAWGAGFRATAGSPWGADGVNSTNMRVYQPWYFQATPNPALGAEGGQRLADYIRFLGDTQQRYYAQRVQQIRGTGFKGVTVASNWIAGENGPDPSFYAGPLPGGSSGRAPNLWADQTADAIDRHGYWQGPDGDWRIVTTNTGGSATPGQVLGTMLKTPGGGLLDVGMYQVEDKPFNYSEWSSTPPNWYQAEAAPLMAFYGMGLQGWDASFQFASGNYYFNNGYEAGGFLSFYNSDTPVYMGQFPALALAVRRGDVAQGGAAAARRITMANAFSGKDAFTQSLSGNGWGGGTGSVATPNEVLAIGRVSANVGDGLGVSEREDWGTYWNQSTKIIKSDTGELEWDYNKGLISVMTQKTQALIGFAGPGTYDLGNFSVNVTTDYVSLMFSSLDGLPLAMSSKVLVTAMSRTKQYGALFNADGTQITQIGSDPLIMQPVEATITLKNGIAQGVDVLDFYGVPTGQSVPVAGNTFVIDGRYATYYYQINVVTEDSLPPQAQRLTVSDVGPADAGKTVYSFTIRYTDNILLDPATVDGDEIEVMKQGTSALLPVTLMSKSVSADGKTIDATYSFVPPGGDWSVSDDGTYVITALSGTFADHGPNLNAEISLGTFTVAVTVPDTTPPVVSIGSVGHVGIPQLGQSTYQFSIIFTDNTSMNSDTVDGDEIRFVRQSTGDTLAVTLVSKTASVDGKTVTATYSITPPGGTWSTDDAGTYAISSVAGTAADSAGRLIVGANLASLVAAFVRPVVARGSVTNVDYSSLNFSTYTFTVRYTDDMLLPASSINGDEIQIQRQGSSAALPVSLKSKAIWPDGKTIDATYTLTPPGGTWTEDDTGTYVLTSPAGSFYDGVGNPNVLTDLGTFTADILPPDTTPPTASRGAVGNVGWQHVNLPSHTFVIRFSDSRPLDASSIDGGEIRVNRQSTNAVIPVSLVSKTVSADGKTVDATYALTAPGGSWNAADTDTYLITALAGTFLDAAGNANRKISLGSFSAAPAITGTEILVIEGTPGNDTITLQIKGESYEVNLNGTATSYPGAKYGKIVIHANAGNDAVTITGNVNIAEVHGGTGQDTLTGGDGLDTLRGDEGNDLITGGAGVDVLYGNFDNDTLIGGDGDDSMLAGLGLDSLRGNAGNDSLFAGDGTDVIWGEEGNDYIEGRGKADTIHGGAGNDSIIGGAGSDVIYGDDGDDYIDDSASLVFHDTVYGGAGRDTVRYDDDDFVFDHEVSILA